MSEYEVTQKILIFLIGITVGAGSYIPWSLDFPVSGIGFVEIPVAEVLAIPSVLGILVFSYILAEASEPSGLPESGKIEVAVSTQKEVGDEEDE